jgi:CelD/BcsL family acetyltransferase involved in cellulose biosynthesis
VSLTDLLRADVVTDGGELPALRQWWNETCRSMPVPNVFLSWEWTTTWWSHFGHDRRLHVVVLRDSAGVAAIAPLQISRVGVGPVSSRVLERISPEAGDYGGLIVARRHADVAEALLDHVQRLLRRARISAFVLSRLASDDPFAEPWRSATQRRPSLRTDERRLEGSCLYTDVRADFVLSRHTKKHKIRQRLRRITEAHDQVAFTHHTGDDLDRGLDWLLAVHGQRWAEREDELQGLLAAADREAFMLDAIRALDEQGWVRLLSLSADGRPVAVELDFELGDRVFMFKGAFDPDFAPYSPGQLLHHRVFEDAVARGVAVVDFGRGDQLYKQRWANGERHLLTTTTVRAGRPGQLSAARLRLGRAAAVRWPQLAARLRRLVTPR